MIVTIRHSTEQTGMLTKTTHYCVEVKAQFSQEEAHIINKIKMGELVIMDRDPSSFSPPGVPGVPLTLQHLIIGNKYGFHAPLAARDYASELKDKLPNVKRIIMGNADIPEEERIETIEV